MTSNYTSFDLFDPTEEHGMLRKSLREFVAKKIEPGAQERDKKEFFDRALFRNLGDLGLLGITVPAEFGGSEMDATACLIVHEELSASDPGLCLAYLAHAILCANNISTNANPQQKSRWLPRLCSGEWIGAMAMSEPSCGTDVMAMKSRATKTSEGFSLSGRKMWITNGVIDEGKTPADCVFVYAKTGAGEKEISSFLVEQGFAGYSVGQKIKDKTGMRASNTAELVFDQCEIPESNMIGELGDSSRHMMRNLELERLCLASMSLGIARRALDIMVNYSKERRSFGKPLFEIGQVQQMIGDSFAEYRAARSYCYDVARRLACKKGNTRLDSDGVKLFAAPVGKRIADRAIQVLGGYGYVAEYNVERLWRDAKLLEIGGGTLEAHQKNISLDLGKERAWL